MKLKIKGNVRSGLVRAAAFLTMAPTALPAHSSQCFFSRHKLKSWLLFSQYGAIFPLCGATLVLFWLELMNREGFTFSSLFSFFTRRAASAQWVWNWKFGWRAPPCKSNHSHALFSCWLSPFSRTVMSPCGFKYMKSLRLTDRGVGAFLFSLTFLLSPACLISPLPRNNE